MNAPEVRLTDDEIDAVWDGIDAGRVLGAVEGIVAARLAAQAEQAAGAVEAYSPCHGGEELNANHIRYRMPFHEWQAGVAAALRGES